MRALSTYRRNTYSYCFLEDHGQDSFDRLLRNPGPFASPCACTNEMTCQHLRKWLEEHGRMVDETYPYLLGRIPYGAWVGYCFRKSANCNC